MSKKIDIVTSNPFTPVEVVTNVVDGSEQSGFRNVLVTDDAGQRKQVASVSPNYSLIHNEVLYQAAQDVMSRAEHNFTHLKTFWDGKRYLEYFRTDEAILEGGLHMGLLFRNSYDGSSLAMLAIYMLNAHCLNEYHSSTLFGAFEMRHTTSNAFDNNSLDDALKNLQAGAQNCVKLGGRIEEMKESAIDVETVCKAKAANLLPAAKWPDVLDCLNEEKKTEFGLFQSLTNVATHKLHDWHGHKYRELATEYFLSDKATERTNREAYYDKQHLTN